MFKEGRRSSSLLHDRNLSWSFALTCLLLPLAWATKLAADDAEAEPEKPAAVAIATDMDAPAELVPHEELELELDFGGDLPSVGEEERPLFTEPLLQDARGISLAQPESVEGSARRDEESRSPHQLREPKPFRGEAEESVSPEEIARVRELMEDAHAAAQTADSPDDFTAVIDISERGERSTSWAEGRGYFRRLASWAYNRRGEERLRQHPEKAMADFAAAVRHDPQNWRARHNRAISFAQRGDLAAAIRDFGEVIRLRPDYGTAYRNRGEAYFAAGQYEEAIKDYTRALAHLQDAEELYFLRADSQHRLGRLPQALADYNTSLESNQNRPEWHVGRASVHADLGDYAAAIADLDRAIKMDPQHAEAYRAVAWILATCPDPRYRRPEKALVAARHALEVQGESHPLYYDTLAAAYAAGKQFQQAATIQQHAIQLATGHEEEEALRARLALYSQSRPFVTTTPHLAERPPDERARPIPPRSAGRAGLRQPQRMTASPR